MRREAAAYCEVPGEHDGDLQDKTSDIVPPVEMDTMVKEEVAGWRSVRPLNGVDGTSELRRRNTPNHAPEEESVWTLKVRTRIFLRTPLKFVAAAAHHLRTTDTDPCRSAGSSPFVDGHDVSHIDSLDG
jgi:hypothetical protein